MTDFLLKSTLSLAVLLAMYHLFLAKEKMHRFNRFYLLFSLAFSLVLPFITFKFSSPVAAQPLSGLTTILLAPAIISANKTNYLPYLGWGIYGVITLVLLLRFANNLLHFKRQVNRNEHLKYNGAVLILLKANVLPHTFFNYIFINKDEHEHQIIESELYTHELAHVQQKHTIDVLFIELLKTVFWFNPLLYFYKKSIQLNHEFLADETVVNAHYNIITYQKLLVEKAATGATFSLASNLNFAITKKRLLMMTKTTPRLLATVKQLAIVPLFAGLLFVSCADDNNADTKTSTAKTAKEKVYSGEGLTKQPDYPGGILAFYSYVTKNFNIPKNLNGTFKLYVSFVVETDGTLSDIKVIKDPTNGPLGTEALRILKSSEEKWLPAEADGKRVRASYTLPITINVAN